MAWPRFPRAALADLMGSTHPCLLLASMLVFTAVMGMFVRARRGKSLVRGEAPVTPFLVRATAFRILAAICALHVSGIHFLALQTAAWTGMLVSRAQETTVAEAVRTTFDGDHPCSLCQAVETAKEQEKDNAPMIEKLAKSSFVKPGAVEVPAPPFCDFAFEDCRRSGRPRADSPPSPPPRLS